MLSHTEVFDNLEKYYIELPHELSNSQLADTAESECVTGTEEKLDVD